MLRPTIFEFLNAYDTYMQQAQEMLGQSTPPSMDRQYLIETYHRLDDESCIALTSGLQQNFREEVKKLVTLSHEIFRQLEAGIPPPPKLQDDLDAFRQYLRGQEERR